MIAVADTAPDTLALGRRGGPGRGRPGRVGALPAHPHRHRPLQGLWPLRRGLPEGHPRPRRDAGERAGLPPGPHHPPRALHVGRPLRAGLPRLRHRRPGPPPAGPGDDGMSAPPAPARGERDRPPPAAPPPARPHEGQRGDRRGRDPRRVRRLLRLPDHAAGRAPRVDGPPDARGGSGLRPGRVGARGDQHGPRRRRDGGPGPRLLLVARDQPDGRGHELHGRLRGPVRPRQRHARRPRPRIDRAEPVGLLPGGQGARPRRLPDAGAGAGLDRRGDGAHGRRLRARRALPDPRVHPGRRHPRPGDGAGRADVPGAAAAGRRVGRRRRRGPAAAGRALAASSSPRTSSCTTGTCRPSSPRSRSARCATRASASRTPTS